MPDFSDLLIFALLIFAIVLAAGLVPFAHRISAQPKVLYSMTCLAAGFLISAAMLIAIPEGFALYLAAPPDLSDLPDFSGYGHDHGHESAHSSGLVAGTAVLLGFVFMLVLEGFGFGHDVHEEHHDHEAHHSHDHVNHPSEHSSSLVIGLTLHAFMDGLVLAAAFSLGELVLSIQLAVVVLMHKFPAAFSLSAYSLHERSSRKRSFLDLLFFAISTPLAMIISWNFFVIETSEWQGLAVLFAAGSFIYVATVDVLPSIHVRAKSKRSLGLVMLGMALMLIISFAIAEIFPGLDIH